MPRWFWKLVPHEHSAKNEVFLYNDIVGWATHIQTPAGPISRLGRDVPIHGYVVRCKKCGVKYGVPVG